MQIKSISWFDERYYKITKEDGSVDYIPSITTKLGAVAKPFLTQWYGDLGTREANLRKLEQGDRGSRLHYAWQIYTTGGAVIFNDYKVPAYTQAEIIEIEKKYGNKIAILPTQDEMYQMTKLERFYKAIQPEDLQSEMIVYDLENRDAGTLDNLLKIKEGEYLINGKTPLKLPAGFYIFDLKTGNYLGKEAQMQVAAYAKCVEKMSICKVVGGLIGHTSATTKTGIEGFATVYLNKEQLEEEYLDYRKVAGIWEKLFADTKPKIRELPSLITIKL